jgi:hypothetical protein
MKENDNLGNLDRAIAATHNSIQNRLITRRNHSSYGVTKGSLQQELHQLYGLLYAYYLVNGMGTSVMPTMGAGEAAALLGIDLTKLHVDIKNA